MTFFYGPYIWIEKPYFSVGGGGGHICGYDEYHRL